MPAGTYKVKASIHPHSMTREIELPEGEDRIVNFGGDLGALSLEGRVLNGEQTPIRGAIVTLTPQFDWHYAEFKVATGGEGEYWIDGLKPGTYEVRAWALLPGRGARDLVRTLEIYRGDVTEDFVFEANGRGRK